MRFFKLMRTSDQFNNLGIQFYEIYQYSWLEFFFVLCVASPRKNLSQGPSFGGCGLIYASFRSKSCIVLRENS